MPEPITSAESPVLKPDAPLAALTTFGVPARAAWFATLEEEGHLPRLLDDPRFRDSEYLILGGGSNVLFTRDFAGLVIRMAIRGIQVATGEAGDWIRVGAGENWDAFVRWSLAQGYHGLENLILIPGSVGAAPIQNIGAYGVEVAEFLESVRVWDANQQRFRDMAAGECDFAYRDSRFKREAGRFVVTGVCFHLPRAGEPRIDYAGIRDELAAMGVESAPGTVGEAVERLRRRKLPQPSEMGNAGSFFQNPVVDTARAEALRSRFPELPAFAVDGGWKLSAAWMIEDCGLRGWRDGPAGVSERHALVLVNHGGATGEQIWSLAERVREAVHRRFGIILTPEPRIY